MKNIFGYACAFTSLRGETGAQLAEKQTEM